MRMSTIGAIAVASFFTVTTAAFAQTPTQTQPQTPTQTSPQTQPQPQTPPPPTPAQPQTQPPPQTPPPSTTTPTQTSPQTSKSGDTAAMQTFTGCVMSEPDYRKAHNLGEGALKGAGLGDEFVLVDVKVSPVRGTASASSGSDMSASTSRPGSTSSSMSASSCADKGQAYRLTGTQEEKIKGLVGHQLEVQGRFKHADDVAEAGAGSGKLPAEVEIVSFREVPGRTAVTEPVTPSASVTRTPDRTATPTTEPRQTTEPRPSTTEPKTLPHTASPAPLLALVGLLALSSGVALTVLRRRAL